MVIRPCEGQCEAVGFNFRLCTNPVMMDGMHTEWEILHQRLTITAVTIGLARPAQIPYPLADIRRRGTMFDYFTQ